MKRSIIIALLCGVAVSSPTAKLEHLGDAPLYHGGFYQGDMVVDFDPSDRHAIVDNRQLWPQGIVYYELHSSVENFRENILDGMKEYEEKTCITFREKTADTKDYIKISFYNGCWSTVGRRGGMQEMSLGRGCHYRGLVVHEIAHALGFQHEQQRSDRDQYIDIIWGNILEGFEDQFVVMKVWETNDLGEHFDYNSVMLYEETAFSKDGVSPTVRPKQAGVSLIPVWKRNGLSESDVRRVNRLYQCFGNVRPSPPDVPDFFCDFEQGFCGFENQEWMGSDFNRRQETIGGRTGMMLVMKAEDRVGRSRLGRFYTPYFENLGRDFACLSFDWFMDGPGAEYMKISFQSTTNGSTDLDKYWDAAPNWRTWKRTIKYEDKDPRIFILASHHTKGSNFTFALDNFRFTLKPCE